METMDPIAANFNTTLPPASQDIAVDFSTLADWVRIIQSFFAAHPNLQNVIACLHNLWIH